MGLVLLSFFLGWSIWTQDFGFFSHVASVTIGNPTAQGSHSTQSKPTGLLSLLVEILLGFD